MMMGNVVRSTGRYVARSRTVGIRFDSNTSRPVWGKHALNIHAYMSLCFHVSICLGKVIYVSVYLCTYASVSVYAFKCN